MRSKAIASALCLFIALLIPLSFVPMWAAGEYYTVDEVNGFIDGIVAYKLGGTGSADVQDWIDGALSGTAGQGSEWYIIGLSQSGYSSFSGYEEAL